MLNLITLTGTETDLSAVLADNTNFLWWKFVVVEQRGKRYVCLFSPDIIHSEAAAELLAFSNATFVAAGKLNFCCDDVDYDSGSCREKYGYDRPQDTKEAKKLLEELKTILYYRNSK